MPLPYEATFTSTPVYWSMHVTLFGSAILLWREILHHSSEQAFGALAVGVLSSMQMGLLGAVLTLAERPLFTPHLLTTQAWGFTPLEDQQLGGALMWVPGICSFPVDIAALVAAALGSARRRRGLHEHGSWRVPAQLSQCGRHEGRAHTAADLVLAAWSRSPSASSSAPYSGSPCAAIHPWPHPEPSRPQSIKDVPVARGSRLRAVDHPRGLDFRDSSGDSTRMDHGHARGHLRASVEPRPRARRHRPPMVVGGALRLGRARAGVSDGERDPHSGGRDRCSCGCTAGTSFTASGCRNSPARPIPFRARSTSAGSGPTGPGFIGASARSIAAISTLTCRSRSSPSRARHSTSGAPRSSRPRPHRPRRIKRAARQLVEYRCGLCHQVRGTLAGALSAPDLTHIASRRTIAAGTLLNNPGNLSGWIENPQAVKPGTLMPNQFLSAQELSDVRAYLETLQ